MKILLALHIAAGILALLAGTTAGVACKGGRLHARAGSWFVAAMLALGVTASMLEPFRTPPGSPLVGIFVCYFVLTGWMTARRGRSSGRSEFIAGLVAVGFAAATAWGGVAGASTTPAGRGPVFILAALCLLAGVGDLRVALHRKLTATQRITRHLWRMCFAFFIATGSFFLGPQQVMPSLVRGSPAFFVLAFAPFALMLFWLVRVRFPNSLMLYRRSAGAAEDRLGQALPEG